MVRAATDGDLLAEHGADGDLVAVDVAGDAQAGTRGDERPEQRVAAEHLVDGDRVAVGVEQTADPLDTGRGVAEVVEGEGRQHERRLPRLVVVADVEADRAGAVRERERAGVPALAGRLDARHGAQGEEREQVTAGVRRPDGQPHGHGARRAGARLRGVRGARSARAA